MSAAREADRKLDSDEELSTHERRYCEFRDRVERAEAEFEASLVQSVARLARPHRMRRVTVRQEPLRERGVVVRDADGEPLLVTTRQVVEDVESVDLRAAIYLLERIERQRTRRIERDALVDDTVGISELERRLAEAFPSVIRRSGEVELDEPEPGCSALVRVDDVSDSDDDYVVAPCALDVGVEFFVGQ